MIIRRFIKRKIVRPRRIVVGGWGVGLLREDMWWVWGKGRELVCEVDGIVRGVEEVESWREYWSLYRSGSREGGQR